MKGSSTEAHCLVDFVERDITILKPWNEGTSYDFMIHTKDNKVYKIQCKTAYWAKDTVEKNVAFEIRTYRLAINTKRTLEIKYTKEEVDFFYTHFEGKSYLVPFEETQGKKFRWRYEYPVTNQKKGIHIAKDYELDIMLRKLNIIPI